MEEDFRLREDTYLTFPPKVNDLTIREAIRCFQVNIENTVKHIDYVCCYCSRFVNLSKLESILNNNAVLLAAFETYILHCCDLNVCGYYSGSFNFCHDCWTCVNGGRKPKFGISNKMSQLYCQYYPALLKDLTSVEEAVIAKVYPVVTILKLRPNNSFNPETYRGLCRHFVLLPQNLGLLLILLPLEMTSVDNVMQVIWVDKILPQLE